MWDQGLSNAQYSSSFLQFHLHIEVTDPWIERGLMLLLGVCVGTIPRVDY